VAHSLGVNAQRISPIVTQMAPADRAKIAKALGKAVPPTLLALI